MEKLLHEGTALVNQEKWLQYCTSVKRLEGEAWVRDGALDTNLDSLIGYLGSHLNSSGVNNGSDMSGVEAMKLVQQDSCLGYPERCVEVRITEILDGLSFCDNLKTRLNNVKNFLFTWII